MPNRVARNFGRHVLGLQGPFATWRSENADADAYWTLDACDAFGQRWLVHHDELLKAVVLLGEMLGVKWEDG